MTTIDTAIARRPWMSGRKPLARPAFLPAPAAVLTALWAAFCLVVAPVGVVEVVKLAATSCKGQRPNIIESSRRASAGPPPAQAPGTLDATQIHRFSMKVLRFL